MTDDRGRWFRVYAAQLRDHPKFRDLTALELGAWTALRSEAELRDRAIIVDRDEALLILKRRKVPRAAVILDLLIGRRLFDVDGGGYIHVHDRADHDRSDLSVEQQSHRRNHRRSEPTEGCEFCLIERWDRSVGTYGGWVPVDVGGSVDLSTSTPRGLPQQAEPATDTDTATEPAPEPQAETLPAEDDPVTAACRYLPNGGQWLGDSEYRAAWTELVRRFGDEWVLEALPKGYAECLKRGKVRAWDLKRFTEWVLAERNRRDELAAEKADREKAERESRAHLRLVHEATPEEQEQARYQQAAIRLGIKLRCKVPTEPAEVRAFVDEHGGLDQTAGAAR